MFIQDALGNLKGSFPFAVDFEFVFEQDLRIVDRSAVIDPHDVLNGEGGFFAKEPGFRNGQGRGQALAGFLGIEREVNIHEAGYLLLPIEWGWGRSSISRWVPFADC